MKHYRWLLLMALAASPYAAFGQACPQWDSNNPGCWTQQREQEDQRRRQEEETRRQREEEDDRQRESEAQWAKQMREREPERQRQAQQQADYAADLNAMRARLLASAPLPAGKNPLLGRWKIVSGRSPRATDDLSQLMGMLANPEGAMCAVVFGEGTTEFLPDSWASHDSYGNDSLGPIQYRIANGRVYALPAYGVPLLGFDIVDRNTISEIRMPDCKLARVAAARASGAPPASGAPGTPKASSATNNASVQAGGDASQAQPPPLPQRRPPEVCRKTLLDQLGTSRVEQARQAIGTRFEKAIDGKAPDLPGGLRIDARGSDCDDPRLKNSLYDFDAGGVLQSITYVWDRPAGAAPSAIFNERVTTLSRFHSLPSPQSPGRVQADTSLGRLTLLDAPDRNHLLETYRAAK